MLLCICYYIYITMAILSSRVSSVGSALATFMGVHGSSQVRTRSWSTEFSDIVATGFTQTITKGTWLEELDYVN